MEDKNKRYSFALPVGIAFGTGLGAVIGFLTKNIGLWIPIGAAIGVGIGTSIYALNLKKDNNNKNLHHKK